MVARIRVLCMTQQWILVKHASGHVKLDGPNRNFDLVERELPQLQDNQLLVKVIAFANDPILRTWIAPDIDASRFYKTPMSLGSVVDAYALAVVQESRSQAFKAGDHVITETGWTELAMVSAGAVQLVDPLPKDLSMTLYLGSLGYTGLTAYFSLNDVLQATKDDVILVSGAAGATGSMIVQIAKKLIGCRKVIGIAGGAEKCRWVESLGADVCLDYKSSTFKDDLVKATPGPEDFINAFHDNVGGKVLEAGLSRMALRGRVAACGDISNYNDEDTGLKNWLEVVKMRLQIRGLVVFDFATRFGEALRILTDAVINGKLDVGSSEHIVDAPLKDVPKVWTTIFQGANTGKLVTRLQS
ncbi:hypothetical protein AMS68_004206 [Peltaster fructicola]|uniref:Enoyl reductase (ER) domain-containing protein n=1 Tax=Peltaster fructicola TaxID=286661 RepID=A0A6H0XVP5_9PEZI|nr:hypothetical protein AMS68_004206 [Peltaster fructicola]